MGSDGGLIIVFRRNALNMYITNSEDTTMQKHYIAPAFTDHGSLVVRTLGQNVATTLEAGMNTGISSDSTGTSSVDP